MKALFRVVSTAILAGLSVQALAFPALLGEFSDFYAEKDIDVSPLTDMACSLCHAGLFPNRRNLNAYGQDLQAQVEVRADRVDFTSVEGLDSDADGFTNLEEIAAGTLPGDAASFPEE